MSALTKLLTFDPMDNVTVTAVSSEATGRIAEQALKPLEPNFYWQANQSNAKHLLTLDLGVVRPVSGVMFIHHSTSEVEIDISYSLDNSTWHAVTEAGDPDGTAPNDASNLIHVRFCINPANSTDPYIMARYWKVEFRGVSSPNYYAPSDLQVSACWLFTTHTIDKGHITPRRHFTDFPASNSITAHGKSVPTGYGVNPIVHMDRTWFLTDTELAVLREVMGLCDGTREPLVLIDDRNTPELCRFRNDVLVVERIDIGVVKVTAHLETVAIVQKGELH